MTIGQLIGGGIGILAILSVFIEITPIKWNPLSTLFVWVGKKANAELLETFHQLEEKIDNVETAVDELRAEANEQSAITYRVRILRFGDEILHGTKHSKESFDQVLADIDGYEKYCLDHPDFKNNKTVLTTSKIMETYSACIDNNTFL